jgi:hypothetical protein
MRLIYHIDMPYWLGAPEAPPVVANHRGACHGGKRQSFKCRQSFAVAAPSVASPSSPGL